MWRLVFTASAQRDARKIAAAGLRHQAEKLLKILRSNPYHSPPRFERLVGDLKGACSRRITVQHRLVYEVIESARIVKILRMWSHYE